jgi:uncharacterized membrane protein
MPVKAILQGKWLGHPLHPALVHVPVGLFPAALLFDALSRAGIGGNAVVQMSFYCIALGLIGSLLAAPAGLADWLEIKPDKPAYRIGLWHMGLNIVVVVIWVLNLVLRWAGFRRESIVGTAPLVLSAVGTAVLLVSGYLGSRMVFDQGVGIARMTKGKWRKLAMVGGSNVAAESGGDSQ